MIAITAENAENDAPPDNPAFKDTVPSMNAPQAKSSAAKNASIPLRTKSSAVPPLEGPVTTRIQAVLTIAVLHVRCHVRTATAWNFARKDKTYVQMGARTFPQTPNTAVHATSRASRDTPASTANARQSVREHRSYATISASTK